MAAVAPVDQGSSVFLLVVVDAVAGSAPCDDLRFAWRGSRDATRLMAGTFGVF